MSRMGMTLDDKAIGKKVMQLEKTLKVFQDEVNMKMAIVEQILNNRNEQFKVQKELLNREQTLYQTVMVHWKDIANLASNGLSLQFTDGGAVGAFTDSEMEEDWKFQDSFEDDDDSSSVKEKRPSSSKARRERYKKQTAKRSRKLPIKKEQGSTASGSDIENCEKQEVETLYPLSPPAPRRRKMAKVKKLAVPELDAADTDGVEFTDISETPGFEKKVFSNFYKAEPEKKRASTSNPVWKHFLREEGGYAALCKPCENDGIQKIVRVSATSSSNLKRHLKRFHEKIYNQTFPEIAGDGEGDSCTETEIAK